MTVGTFPADDAADPAAYEAAFDSLRPGDAVTIYTPVRAPRRRGERAGWGTLTSLTLQSRQDDTHCAIALAAIERGLHVLLTKPLVKTLAEHYKLFEAARRKGVLLVCEVHKRWDPMYTDARDRIRVCAHGTRPAPLPHSVADPVRSQAELGDFSYLTSYMSQPKRQLHTFRAWAGRGSDISYYLNSHHVDFHEARAAPCAPRAPRPTPASRSSSSSSPARQWCVGDSARPEVVTAAGAKGVAKREIGVDTEDTVALTATWRTLATGSSGVRQHTHAHTPSPRAHTRSRPRQLTPRSPRPPRSPPTPPPGWRRPATCTPSSASSTWVRPVKSTWTRPAAATTPPPTPTATRAATRSS